jgi:hypothetical protein
MIIETVPIGSLLPDPSNERLHGEKNIAAIKGSLAKFGQVEPLILNKRNGVLIGGHGRLEAMKQLGMTEAQIVHVDLDNTQAAALRVALNRTAEIAEWDLSALQETLRGLQSDAFDLEEIGFDAGDLKDFGLGIDESFLPNIEDVDPPGFQNVTFILSNEQKETIDRAIGVAKDMGEFIGTGNENSNGNAIARVAEFFLTGQNER